MAALEKYSAGSWVGATPTTWPAGDRLAPAGGGEEPGGRVEGGHRALLSATPGGALRRHRAVAVQAERRVGAGAAEQVLDRGVVEVVAHRLAGGAVVHGVAVAADEPIGGVPGAPEEERRHEQQRGVRPARGVRSSGPDGRPFRHVASQYATKCSVARALALPTPDCFSWLRDYRHGRAALAVAGVAEVPDRVARALLVVAVEVDSAPVGPTELPGKNRPKEFRLPWALWQVRQPTVAVAVGLAWKLMVPGSVPRVTPAPGCRSA